MIGFSTIDDGGYGYRPDEDDAYTRPCGQLGGRTSASFAGRLLGEFDTDDAAEEAIRRAMDRAGFWPNLWRVDDHGGATLSVLGERDSAGDPS